MTTNAHTHALITVNIFGERTARMTHEAFHAMIRDRKLAAINLGSDHDIDEWTISDPRTTVTVGRAFVR